MSCSRRPSLSVNTLEERRTPATFSYAAGTLTVTATSTDEDLTVLPVDSAPAGYIAIDDQQVGYSSLTNGEPVKNIVFDLSASSTASVELSSDLALGGSLTVIGAKTQTMFLSSADIGKNLTITGGAGTETITLTELGSIGGNVTIAMGGGDGEVKLQGGKIHGSLSVVGGTGKDIVRLTADGNMEIGGSASFKLGLGADEILSAGNGTFRVNGDLFIAGGADGDNIDLEGVTDTVLKVGGDLTMKMGKGSNDISTFGVEVGGNLALSAGVGGTDVYMGNFTSVGAAATFTMGDSVNFVDLDVVTTGGSLTYTGGLRGDLFSIDAFQIGRDLIVNTLGDNIGGAELIEIGSNDFIPCNVFGSVSVSTGVSEQQVYVARTDINGKLTIATGADDDLVYIDDTNVTGATSIKLGAGNDILWIDNQNNDDGGSLIGEITTFGGAVSVAAGAGDDEVNLAADAGNQVWFGSASAFLGGSGNDTLDNAPVNDWFGADGTEDFEAGNGVELA